MTMQEHAVALARVGYRLVPLPANMKAAPPINWPELATSDASTVSSWWENNPNANIAVVCGRGLLVLDIDPRNGGDLSLQALESKHGQLPPTLTATTPSGGRHLYFAGPDVPNSSGKLGPGLDLKSRNGYVVAAPSYTIKGPKQSEGKYAWIDVSVAPAMVPQWIIELNSASKVTEVVDSAGSAFKIRVIEGEQLADLKSALEYLKSVPAIASNALWSEVGYSLLSLADQGRSIWCEWSSEAPGFTSGAPESWWDNHRSERARTDYRHVFTIAQSHGWVNPRSRVAQAGLPFSASRFTPIDAWSFADGPDPQWRIDGLLPEQGLGMIYGPSGCGKSFFTLDMMMAIARGIPYGYDKRSVRAARVVYVVAEGVGGFRKRLRAYRSYHHIGSDCLAPKLIIAAPNLTSTADVSELQQAILASGGADVIVVDTLHASAAGADENSSQDMGLLLNLCRALQSATDGLILLVHHSGKDPERGARGSSALRAAMDVEIEVSRCKDHAIVSVKKQRDGDDSAVMCFRLVPVPQLSVSSGSSVAVEHLPVLAKSDSSRKARVSEDQVQVIHQVQAMSNADNGVQLEVLAHALSTQRPDKRPDSIKRSITRAIDAGLLMIDVNHAIRLPMTRT